MAYRLTLAVPDAAGAETFYDRLAAEFQTAVFGQFVRLVRRDRFIELFDDDLPDTTVTLTQVVHISANAVADYIVDTMEASIVGKLVLEQYNGCLPVEADEIKEFCHVLLQGAEESPDYDEAQRRKNEIARKAEVYLNCNPYMEIVGFLRFRLGSYMSELRDTVEYAIDEYVSNKQYREFIALLKYFVYFQDAKIPQVHLIHYGENKYAMLDDRMNPIEPAHSDEVVVETIDRELNYEDMIVSSLISASPGHVHIHTREPDTLSIKTIHQIFEDRTTTCTGCMYCHALLDDHKFDGVKVT